MKLTKQRFLIIGLIALGMAIAGFFGMRSFRALGEFRRHRPPAFPPPAAEPAETNVELIRDWMTIGFLSHTYRTPPDLLYKALGIRPNGNERKSLKQLNDEYFPENPGFVLETVKAAIQASQTSPTEIPLLATIPPAKIVPSINP
jgi:hypothetical protein